MKTQAFFQNIRQQLIEELAKATNQVIVAVAWFTDKKIFNLLLIKAKEGIDVQIMIVDDEINREYGPDYDELLSYNGTVVKVISQNPEVLMHNKFCIIDGKTVITGSYNWSRRAGNNHENITITWDEQFLAKQFLSEFEALKKRYSQYANSGKASFNYSKISLRLQMVKSLINLNEFQELALQLEKLQEFDLVPEVEQIIVYIQDSHYSDALIAIDQLEERYNSLVSLDEDKIASLKLQLIYLEIEFSSLQGQNDTLEKTISEFRDIVRVALGDIMLQLLNLKIEWNKIREKQGKVFEYEDLKDAFKKFEDEVKKAKGSAQVKLSKEEDKELKELYKKGVKLCHPDKVQDPFKVKAQDIFVRLKRAFDANNLSQVNRIVISLESGIWELGPELTEIKEVKKLERLVQELMLRIGELRKRIEELATSDDYKCLQDFENVEIYIKEQEISIKKDIINYREKIIKYKNEQSATTN